MCQVFEKAWRSMKYSWSAAEITFSDGSKRKIERKSPVESMGKTRFTVFQPDHVEITTVRRTKQKTDAGWEARDELVEQEYIDLSHIQSVKFIP